MPTHPVAGSLRIALMFLCLLGAGPGTGQASEVEQLGLSDIFRRVDRAYPELAIVAAEQAGAEALRSLAVRTRFIPTVKSSNLFGVVPAARGTVFDSPDSPRDLDDLGPFYRVRVEATLPLYTFGQLTAGQQAATRLVESKQAKAQAKRAQAYALSSRAYFGYLLAQGSLSIIDEVDGHLSALLDKLQNPGEDDPEPEPLDILRARNYGFELETQRAEVVEQQLVAADGLRELVGNAPDKPVRPAEDGLVALDPPPAQLTDGIAMALERRPELREVDLLRRASQLRADMARKERLPTLALVGRYERGRASNREAQDNPFIYEPFNTDTLTAVLAVQWDLSFAQLSARARQHAATAAEIDAKGVALSAVTRHEVAEAHARLVRTVSTYETSRRAVSTAANWFRIADEGYGLGSASVKDVIDAYANYIKVRSGQLRAIHDLNLAVIGWRLAIGEPPL